MALQGTLKDFSLADIFQLIGLQRKTGMLTLKRGDETVTVSFLDGSVVAADSLKRRLEDRLGAVLVKSNQISQRQLDEALRIQRMTLQRLGKVLVELNVISSEALSQALQVQISQIIYRLFRWSDGEYYFSQEEVLDYDREYVVPVSAESILMEGARILDEWPMIERRLGPFSNLYRRTADAEEALEGEEAGSGAGQTSPLEEQVLADLKEARSVHDLVEGSSAGEFDTCKALHQLIERGWVERVTNEAPIALEEASRALAPESQRAAPGRRWLGAVLVAWVAISILTAFFNPLNGLALIRGGHPVSERYLRQVSRTRLERLNYAIQVFHLQNRGYPQDLEYLVVGGLLHLQDLKDPWGHEYRYRPEEDGYQLQGLLPDGEADPLLLLRSSS